MNNAIQGIVLHTQDMKENDAILHVLSEQDEKVSIYARGVKKATSKNAKACSSFQISTFHFMPKNEGMRSLRFVEVDTIYTNLYSDLKKQCIAQVFFEVLYRSEGYSYNTAYRLLKACLQFLNEQNNEYALLAFFIAQCTNLLGFTPQVDMCVHCLKQKPINHISFTQGGFMCVDCYKKSKLYSREQLRLFRFFHKASLQHLSILHEIDCDCYNEVAPIVCFFEQNSGMQLRSIAFLKKVENIKSHTE